MQVYSTQWSFLHEDSLKTDYCLVILWWKGPIFLQLIDNKWLSLEILLASSELIEAELVRNPVLATYILLTKGEPVSGILNLEHIIEVSRFGQFGKLLCVTAFVLRFVSLLKLSNSKGKDKKEILDKTWLTAELNLVKTYWIRTIQARSFERAMPYLLSKGM